MKALLENMIVFYEIPEKIITENVINQFVHFLQLHITTNRGFVYEDPVVKYVPSYKFNEIKNKF